MFELESPNELVRFFARVIQYVVDEAITSGITDILMIIGKGKRTIEEHFDRNFQLEAQLVGQGEELELFANLVKLKDMTFLAIFLDESSLEEKDSYRLHLIPDFLALVEQTEPTLRLRNVPYDEVAQWLKADFEFLKQDSAELNSIFEGTRVRP